MSYKPEGYTSVAPYLIVDGAEEVVQFLEATFEAEATQRIENPDGRLVHAEVRIDDTVVMLGDPGEEGEAMPAMVHVYVEDVEEVYERALDAGAASVEEPRTREGEATRRGGVEGPGGNTWWISTRVG